MHIATGEGILKRNQQDVQKTPLLFLAEAPHRERKIERWINEISIHLAREEGFKALAHESLYSLHPFYERKSLNAEDGKGRMREILAYNKTVPREDRIMVTCIDIEHSIRHSPEHVCHFLNYIIDFCRFSPVKDFLKEENRTLCGMESRDEKAAFIVRMQRAFETNSLCFPDEVQEEIAFFSELLRVSLDFRLPLPEELPRAMEQKEFSRNLEIRSHWFKQTILRALERTKEHSEKSICIVGSHHALKTEATENEPYLGKESEARFFHERHEETKGRVVSVLTAPLLNPHWHIFTKGDLEDPLERAAFEAMGKEERVYLSLDREIDPGDGFYSSAYYAQGKAKYDGLLFLKEL